MRFLIKKKTVEKLGSNAVIELLKTNMLDSWVQNESPSPRVQNNDTTGKIRKFLKYLTIISSERMMEAACNEQAEMLMYMQIIL